MKIFSTGDSHFNLDSRWDECIKAHQWFASEVKEKKPDLVVHGGDLYHAESTPIERRCVANWLKAIADICPILICKGNHDTPLDCHIMGRLAAKHSIVVEESVGIRYIIKKGVKPASVFDSPEKATQALAVRSVAWPDRASFANSLGQPTALQELDGAASGAMRNLFIGIGHHWSEHEGPKILNGHFMVDGSKTGAGQPLIGKEMHISLSDLALAKPDIVFASHVHKPQEFEYDGIPIVLPGSLYRRDFGETEEKSYVVAEFDGSKLIDWHRVKSPCRQMILYQGIWGVYDGIPELEGKSGWIAEDIGPKGECEDAEVRFRYKVDFDRRHEAKAAAEKLKAQLIAEGAVDVKLDPEVITETHARAPEIAQAKTLEDKLIAYWKATGAGLSDKRQTRLLHLLQQLRKGNTNGQADEIHGR